MLGTPDFSSCDVAPQGVIVLYGLYLCAGTCLLPAISGMCEAYMPSYAFNSSSGRCEQFVYGGCQGNDNRDTRGDECLARCNPDGEVVDRCLVSGRECVCVCVCEMCGLSV